jgi:AcrR family transcriptional regulator
VEQIRRAPGLQPGDQLPQWPEQGGGGLLDLILRGAELVSAPSEKLGDDPRYLLDPAKHYIALHRVTSPWNGWTPAGPENIPDPGGRVAKKARSCYSVAMSKGDLTRQAILEHAMRQASVLGLEGLSIGGLADELGLSKSGLFAHFRSKEALQLQVLDVAAERFTELVVRPALAAPRGLPRVRALLDRWMEWGRSTALSGGCLFVQAAIELDDRPGPVRDHLERLQREWIGVLARVATTAVEQGVFHARLEPEQFAFDLYGVMLSYHHATRLLRDPSATAHAHRALERLVEGASVPASRLPRRATRRR